MPRSLQLNFPPTEVQTLSPARQTALPEELRAGNGARVIAEPDPVHSVSPTAILVAACEDEREWQAKPDEIAARTQGYEPSYWSRIKAGDRPAQLERIGRLPVKVQKRFVRRYARQLGMEVREETPGDRQRRAIANAQVALANALKEIVNG